MAGPAQGEKPTGTSPGARGRLHSPHSHIGQTAFHTLDNLKAARPQTVAFHLTTHLQQRQFKDCRWLFPQLLGRPGQGQGQPAQVPPAYLCLRPTVG